MLCDVFVEPVRNRSVAVCPSSNTLQIHCLDYVETKESAVLWRVSELLRNCRGEAGRTHFNLWPAEINFYWIVSLLEWGSALVVQIY